jgi:hypothetical protein
LITAELSISLVLPISISAQRCRISTSQSCSCETGKSRQAPTFKQGYLDEGWRGGLELHGLVEELVGPFLSLSLQIFWKACRSATAALTVDSQNQ